MNKLFRFYNNNRHTIWVVAVSIVAVIIIIHFLDSLVENNNKTNENNDVTNGLNSNYSIITGQEIKKDVLNVVDEFIDYCNNGQKEEAYNLLSSECKEILYPSIDDFIENYYNRIFNEKKSYYAQAWIAQNNKYTYRVDFSENMLVTGTPSKTSVVDYYTIVKNDDEYKLNINKLIGKETINKTVNQDGIIIYVHERSIYMDYEVYSFEIINNSKATIQLDNFANMNSVYIEDVNGKKYLWYNHEFSESDITIEKGVNKKIDIKFDKEYNLDVTNKAIVFEQIILYNDIIAISVDI